MCDYSLEMYASRSAREGELYRTVRFPSGSVGLASVGNKKIAICVSCGSQLELAGIPAKLQSQCNVGKIETVTFIRLEYGSYRDGIKFSDGKKISLQVLGPDVLVSYGPVSEEQRKQVEEELESLPEPQPQRQRSRFSLFRLFEPA